MRYFDDGDYFKFDDVDFGSGARKLTALIAAPDDRPGRSFELRLDSPTGPGVGVLRPRSTGGWATFAEQSITLYSAKGKHDLFVVAKGGEGVANIDRLSFFRG